MRSGFTMVRTTRRHPTESGAGFIEFAISIGVFMLIFFLIIGILQLAYLTFTTHFVLTRVAREMILNSTTKAEVRNRIVELGRNFGLNIAANQVTVCRENENNFLACPDTGQANQPRQLTGIIIDYQPTIGFAPLSTGVRTGLLVRNESFDT